MEPESSSPDPLLAPSPIPNANSPIYTPIRSDSDSSSASDSLSHSSPSPNNSPSTTSTHSTSSDSDSDSNSGNQNPSNSDSVHDVAEEVISYCIATATPSKRLKCTPPIQTLDGLSQLPDSLIHQILSLLPINNAVATSILSKRWRYTWTLTPNLIFKQQDLDPNIDEFISLVNNAVLLYGNSNLKRFALEFEHLKCYSSNVTSWIRFATRRNVEEIDLNFCYDHADEMYFFESDHYRLPQFLFDYTLVKSLNFLLCEIDPGREISWKLLKSLSIGYAALSNELVEKILRGSPVLESLKLRSCRGITRLDVKSASLRKLALESVFKQDDEYEDLEISGNNLWSLTLVGFFRIRKMKVTNVGSLVDARLDFCLARKSDDEDDFGEYRSMVREIFDAVHHVAEVTVGKWCIQVLSMCELKAAPSPLSKHKLLKVDTRLKYWDLPGIARLLRSSPDLETLVLNMSIFSRPEVGIGPNVDKSRLFGENDWASQEIRFSNLLPNLHTVKIVDFIADTSNDLFVSLMQFLLEKARVLKKMVIFPPLYPYIWWMRGSGTAKYLLNVGQSLLSLPRSSSEAEVLLYPMKSY